MYTFSKRSMANLETCCPELYSLATEVMKLQLFDFGITCGHRTKEDQDVAFHGGKSALKYPNSKHNSYPAEAFDFVLLVNGKVDWNNKPAWYMAVGVFRGVAAKLGIKIRCGADWDGDFSAEDQNFHDLPHIELITT